MALEHVTIHMGCLLLLPIAISPYSDMFPLSLNISCIQRWITRTRWVIQARFILINVIILSDMYRCRFSNLTYLSSGGLILVTRCRDLQSYHQYFSMTVQIWTSSKWKSCSSLFLILIHVGLLCMRMYAISGRSCRVLTMFLGIILAAIIFACVRSILCPAMTFTDISSF